MLPSLLSGIISKKYSMTIPFDDPKRNVPFKGHLSYNEKCTANLNSQHTHHQKNKKRVCHATYYTPPIIAVVIFVARNMLAFHIF